MYNELLWIFTELPFCIARVWSTPRNPGSHARALRKVVDKCSTHQRRDDTESED